MAGEDTMQCQVNISSGVYIMQNIIIEYFISTSLLNQQHAYMDPVCLKKIVYILYLIYIYTYLRLDFKQSCTLEPILLYV